MVLLCHICNCIINLRVPFNWTFYFFYAITFCICSRGFEVTFLLCPLMIFDILFMQLWITLTVLQLKILWSLWLLGKCFVSNWRNVFAAFVETELVKSGLNNILFRFRLFGFSDLLLMYFKSTSKPDFFSASSYSAFAILKVSCLEKPFDSLLEMEFGKCFMICGGWFADEWMCISVSLGFFYEQ